MKNDDSLVPDLFEGTIAAAATGGWGVLPVILRRAWPAVTREWQQNASRCLSAAVQTSGMSRPDLEEAIAKDPSAITLTVRLLHHAGMTGADEALFTMGAALGSSLNDQVETTAEDAALIVEAARNLSARHVRLLRLLTEQTTNEEGQEIGWWREAIPEALGFSALSSGMLLDSCTASGTVTTHSGYGSLVYETSELGVEILHLLEHLADFEQS